jgi:hypothetical protein
MSGDGEPGYDLDAKLQPLIDHADKSGLISLHSSPRTQHL